MAESSKPDRNYLNEVFEKMPLSELPKTPLGKVLVLDNDMTVQEAVEMLHGRNILSAPVRDVKVKDDEAWSSKYVGIVDMIKLVVFTLDSMEAKTAIPEEDEGSDNDSVHSLEFSFLPSEFSKRKLEDLNDATEGWFPFLPLETSSNMLDAILLLGTYKIKRLPLIESTDGDIVNIITQSSILHFLAEQMGSNPDLAHLADQTLDELGLADPIPVLSIRSEQPVEAAFDIIRKKGVSAVPVLGEGDALLGHISARHVYYVITARNKQRMLKQPAKNFLARITDRASEWNVRNTAIACDSSDTLKSVIDRMDAAKMHRAYICDKQGRPYRILALCDVLARFVKAPEGSCQLL